MYDWRGSCLVVTTPRTGDYQDFFYIWRVKFHELFESLEMFLLCIIHDKILELHDSSPRKCHHRKYALGTIHLIKKWEDLLLLSFITWRQNHFSMLSITGVRRNTPTLTLERFDMFLWRNAYWKGGYKFWMNSTLM